MPKLSYEPPAITSSQQLESPIWDFLEVKSLPPVCQEVIQSRPFRRLLDINQAGTNYPSNSRFIHSIEIALLANHYYNENCPGSREEFALAALLHDLGHFVFSHTPEMAFDDVCHDSNTKDLVLGHDDLYKIFRKYGINPDNVYRLIAMKDAGNPLFAPSEDSSIGIDHAGSAFSDPYYRNGILWPRKKRQEFLERTHINEKSQLAFRNGDIEIAQAFAKLSIAHNVDAIFQPRNILIDALSCDLLRGLREIGLVSTEHLNSTDQEFIEQIILHPDLPARLQTLAHLVFHVIPDMSEQEIGMIVHRKPLNGVSSPEFLVQTILDMQKAEMTIEDLQRYHAFLQTLTRNELEMVLERQLQNRGMNPKHVIHNIKRRSQKAVSQGQEHFIHKLYLGAPSIDDQQTQQGISQLFDAIRDDYFSASFPYNLAPLTGENR